MRVLVTGARGFVGSALTRALHEADWQVVAAVRQPDRGDNEVAVGDINDRTRWQEALRGCDTVIHLAARAHMMRDTATDPLAAFRAVNTEGTLNLARQAAQAGVRRFVFMSSIKVNGESTPKNRAFSEADVPAPQDAYAQSKWEAEQGLLALARQTGMEVVIVRAPLVYGPGVKGNFASLVRWVRKGMPLPLASVNNRRSLLALDNLTEFIALCADPGLSPHAANEVFLLSDGEDVSTPELLRRVAQAYAVPSRLFAMPTTLIRDAAVLLGKGAAAERLLGSLVVDSSKARRLLDWKPVISMDGQLLEMALYDAHF